MDSDQPSAHSGSVASELCGLGQSGWLKLALLANGVIHFEKYGPYLESTQQQLLLPQSSAQNVRWKLL